jgi:KDO2-lipid IV(A) lauroyltransferase
MVIKESFLRDIGRLFVWFPFRWACSVLPIPFVLLFYEFMGDIHYFFGRGKKKQLIDNIITAFNDQISEKEINNVARRYLENYYTHQLLIFLFPRLNKNRIKKMVSVEGLGYLDQALAKGKGCILIHGHFGLFQLPLFTLGILGYRMNQVTLPVDDGLSYIGKKVAFHYRMEYENKIPARLIPADTFLRPVFSALKRNEVVMIAGDGAGGKNIPKKFVPLDFFQKNYPFPTGPVSLSLKTGAPILPLFIFKKGVCRYNITIGEPIDLAKNSKSSSMQREGLEKFVKLLEENIRQHPCHWRFWDDFSSKVSSVDTIARRGHN